AITPAASSKYRESNSRTSSASRFSESGVKPTRSAKRREKSRRSTVTVGRSADLAGAARELPQSPQNRSPGSFAAPQSGHEIPSVVPHSAQTFLLARLSVPHAAQVVPLVSATRRG